MPRLKRMSKRNPYRALLSEFTPSGVDCLLPFRNDQFYRYVTGEQECQPATKLLFRTFLEEAEGYYLGDKGYTIPYPYKVRKNDFENRELKILHPVIQLSLVLFYDKYANLIAGICKQSSFSIRAPKGISSSLHFRDVVSNEEDDDTISLEKEDKHFRFYKTFFTYRGHTRLFHLFHSRHWEQLEKKFSLMMRTDISNCFPSIYTHSMSWALTSKKYAKETPHKAGNLWNDFDILMRRGNYNETNGIPVGPEVSRVFTELILQSVDKKLEKSLAGKKSGFSKQVFIFKENYSVVRYVDDYFIFANNQEDLNRIRSVLAKTLGEFNLSLNEHKTSVMCRPFQSRKTNALLYINRELDALVETCFKEGYDRCFNKFITGIKAIVLDSELTYSDVANYLHGAIDRRLNFNKRNRSIKTFEKSNLESFKFVKNVLRLVFFFYQVSLTGSSGAKVAKLLFRLKKQLTALDADFLPLFDQMVLEEVELILKSYLNSVGKKISLPVEIFNLLIVASKIQRTSRNIIPEELLIDLFDASSKSYFELVAFQYYVKDDSRFAKIQKRIKSEITKIVHSVEKKNTVQFLVCFDFSTCPYLDETFKKKLLKKICSYYKISESHSIDAILSDLGSTGLFICWDDLHLNNILQKKLLMETY